MKGRIIKVAVSMLMITGLFSSMVFSVSAAADSENVALRKPTASSSEFVWEGVTYRSGGAVDGIIDDTGSTRSRWCSGLWQDTITNSDQVADAEWMYVDLGKEYLLSKVVVKWEAAYGKAYKIQVSNDKNTWRDAANTVTIADNPMTVGQKVLVKETTLNAGTKGRYVKMQGVDRPKQGEYTYGYSIWEFEVYGTAVSTTSTSTSTSSTGTGGSNPTTGDPGVLLYLMLGAGGLAGIVAGMRKKSK